MARQAVGPHAADEQEDHERHHPGGEHEPEVGRGAGQVEDGERHRDGEQAVAEVRRRLAGEEEPELAVAEDAPHRGRVLTALS